MTVEMAQSSHLNIPPSTRIARSTSRESFATDVSLLSLSSFTSEMTSNQNNTEHESSSAFAVDRDDLELDFEKDNELARYREDMLEKMLESHSLAMPKVKHRHRSSNVKSVSKFAAALNDTTTFSSFLTLSQEELLKKCAENDPKYRGSLYKSFSTTDIPSKNEFDFLMADSFVKRGTSQIWIPSDYVQILHCRKQHLKDLKDFNFDDFQNCKDYLTPTESDSNPEISFNNKQQNILKKKITKTHNSSSAMMENSNLSSSSSKSASTNLLPDYYQDAIMLNKRSSGGVGLFLKKLKFSKEMGRRIRDDLLRKLTKRKQQISITKHELDTEKGRPLSKYERNFVIFHWLQSLNEDSFDEP